MCTLPVSVYAWPYPAYWKRRFEFELVSRLLTALGRAFDDGMLRWWQAHRIQDVRAVRHYHSMPVKFHSVTFFIGCC